MSRRTMTLKRIDPWSVLKFGFLVNLCLLVVALLAFGIVWWVVGRLGIIEQVCQLLLDVGFEECGVDGGALFRAVLVIGALGAVILTGLAVFAAFLHNLLADLVGGIRLTLWEEGARREPAAAQRPRPASPPAPSGGSTDRRDASQAETRATEHARSSQPGSEQEPGWTLGSPPPRDEAGTGDRADDDSLFGRREDR